MNTLAAARKAMSAVMTLRKDAAKQGALLGKLRSKAKGVSAKAESAWRGATVVIQSPRLKTLPTMLVRTQRMGGANGTRGNRADRGDRGDKLPGRQASCAAADCNECTSLPGCGWCSALRVCTTGTHEGTHDGTQPGKVMVRSDLIGCGSWLFNPATCGGVSSRVSSRGVSSRVSSTSTSSIRSVGEPQRVEELLEPLAPTVVVPKAVATAVPARPMVEDSRKDLCGNGIRDIRDAGGPNGDHGVDCGAACNRPCQVTPVLIENPRGEVGQLLQPVTPVLQERR